jgi:MinD superfamily P-loop ATPase
MKAADFILLVTEPTPFGLNDLKLAVGAAKLLSIPCGLVLNRSDAGDHNVKDYAAAEDIPVFMEIPFDRQIAETYARGDILVEVMPEWRSQFLALYKKIKALAG